MEILVFNQYYPPDTAATAQRLADLCEGLASSHRVTVICGIPSYDPLPRAVHAENTRVRILRVPSTVFHRSRMVGRVCNYLTYLASAFFVGLFQRRPDLVVAMTDPPIVALIAWFIAFIRRVPFIYLIQDLYPDVAVNLGKIKNPLIIKLFNSLSLFLMYKANQLIAISSSMRERLINKGIIAEKIQVIPNWADTKIVPQPKENPFSIHHGLNKRFVVMYSGNIGLSQNLGVLLQSAKMLEELKDLIVVIIGDGAGKPDLVNGARKLGLTNVLFFPYQPAAEMCYSFGAADVFVIPLTTGLDGLVVPSKVFSIMASARPFIAAIDGSSEVARIAEEFGCGVVVRPGDPKELLRAIRWAYKSLAELQAMGERGREVVERFYNKDIAIAKYEGAFLKVGGNVVGREILR